MAENGNGLGIINEKDWKEASQEQKELWTFRTLISLTKDVRTLKRWATPKMFCGGMVGGALMILILIMFGVKVF
jgi:hypothetical protein